MPDAIADRSAIVGRRTRQQSVIEFRCGLSADEVRQLGGPSDWQCRDVVFSFAYLMSDIPDDVYTEPEDFSPDTLANLGPLRPFANV